MKFKVGDIVTIKVTIKDLSKNHFESLSMLELMRKSGDIGLFLVTEQTLWTTTVTLFPKQTVAAVGISVNAFEHVSNIELAKFRIKNEI